MTKDQFMKRAEMIFVRSNPEAVDPYIKWEFVGRPTRWADGSKGRSGVFVASANGYRTRRMVASYSPNSGFSVR